MEWVWVSYPGVVPLQFKAEASQTDLGNAALVKYLKAELNPSLFKSIY